MKLEDIKNKKALLALKETLKEPRFRQSLKCGALSFICALNIVLATKSDNKVKEEETTEYLTVSLEPVDIPTLIEEKIDEGKKAPSGGFNYRSKFYSPVETPVIIEEPIQEIEPEPEEEPVMEEDVPEETFVEEPVIETPIEEPEETPEVVEEPIIEEVPQVIVDSNYEQKIADTGFIDLDISSMHSYILDTYGVTYEDLIDAICSDYSVSEGAEAIRNREDFLEIKAFFNILTNAKINYILAKHNITLEELNVIFKTYLGENGEYNYSEGYVCANSTGNRMHSASWIYDTDKAFFEGAGYNIYYQITAPHQYSVYTTGSYKKFSEPLQYSTTYGVIDYLVLGESIHNYCSFRDKSSSKGEQLVRRGDKYRELLDDYVENPCDTYGDVNYEITIHLLSGDIVIGKELVRN